MDSFVNAKKFSLLIYILKHSMNVSSDKIKYWNLIH